MELAVGPAMSVRAKIADLYFIPTNDKLIINPSREEEELFKLADTAINTLYSTLPYTPIEAIGYNFLYELEENEVFAIDINFEASRYNELYKTISASAGTESAIQHSLSLNNDAYVVLNLWLKRSGKKKFLSMNYHYQVSNDKDKIKHSLSNFYSNYKHSKLTTSKLIKKG